jgi:hypothetical protein
MPFSRSNRFQAAPVGTASGAAWKRLLRENGIEPNKLRRSQVRIEPKSVTAQGLRPEAVIEKVHASHRHPRLWLRLQWHFGLRPRECAMMDPHESDRGDHLLVLHGAKANRKRAVKFSANSERRAAQRAVLDEAKILAFEHPQWRLHSRGLNTQQALGHFYYVMRKYGITQAELGVIPYSFRHEFAHAEFEEVAGLPAPVLRKVDPNEYAAKAIAVATAGQHLVNQLGHSAKGKFVNYGGSVHEEFRRLDRQRAILDLVAANEALAQATERAGIQEVWLAGKAATGDRFDDGEPIELAVTASKGLNTDSVLEILRAVQALSRPATLAWCAARPEPGLEVVFLRRQ